MLGCALFGRLFIGSMVCSHYHGGVGHTSPEERDVKDTAETQLSAEAEALRLRLISKEISWQAEEDPEIKRCLYKEVEQLENEYAVEAKIYDHLVQYNQRVSALAKSKTRNRMRSRLKTNRCIGETPTSMFFLSFPLKIFKEAKAKFQHFVGVFVACGCRCTDALPAGVYGSDLFRSPQRDSYLSHKLVTLVGTRDHSEGSEFSDDFCLAENIFLDLAGYFLTVENWNRSLFFYVQFYGSCT